MNTSDVLNKAADLIERRGWVGEGGRGWLGEDVGDPLCIEGAIDAAMEGGARAFGGFTSGPNACPAGRAVREYLELGAFASVTESHCLFQWNDEARYDATSGEWVPARTAEQVIATLRAAAVIEAAKENPDARENADGRVAGVSA